MSFTPINTWAPPISNPTTQQRSTAAAVPAFGPLDIAGCALWLDAQDASSITIATGVSQWNDKSGNSRHLTQGTGANQPAYSGTGATAAVTFDGTNDSLSRTAFVQGLGAITVFMVVKPGTLATSKFFMSEDSTASANALNFMFATSTTTATTGRNFVRNDTSGTAHAFGETNQWASSTDTIVGFTDSTTSAVIVYKDATAYTSRATSRSGVYTMTDFMLGRRAYGTTGSCTACTIREVLIYSGVLSQVNREKVEGYTAHRWGLSGLLPALHPYKASPP